MGVSERESMVKTRKKLLPIKIIVILLSLAATVVLFGALLLLGIKTLMDLEPSSEAVPTESVLLELNEYNS